MGFYRDLLGATVTYQFPADGDPWYVALRLGDSHLGVTRQEEFGELVNDRHRGPTRRPGLADETVAGWRT